MRLAAVLVLVVGVLASTAGAAQRLGTPRSDTIRGTARADYVDPRAGRDRVSALGGNDGITATTLLTSALMRVGAKVGYFIPDRIRDGYGFSVRGVDVLGLFPPEFQQPVVMAAALSATTRHGAAAKALITFLTSGAAADAMKESGVEPMSHR